MDARILGTYGTAAKAVCCTPELPFARRITLAIQPDTNELILCLFLVLQQKAKRASAFEGQKQISEMTVTEVEEMAIQKRRAEGTPCTLQNFLAWKEKFDPEMAARAAEIEKEQQEGQLKKKVSTAVDSKSTTGRITGYDFFSDKTNNLEALEAAAEEAGKIEDEEELLEEVDQELFDDDIDLDDLDFESDDEDDDDEDLDI
jgi:hypothetical protein